MTVELTSEDNSVLNYLGGSVEGVLMEVKQTSDAIQCHLDILNMSLIDSAISEKGKTLLINSYS